MAKGTRKQFGKYRLIAHLATGGMAEIYLASHTSLAGFEKLIVIKRILPNLALEGKFVEMFLDEARIAALLNHPNVVQIFDLGRIDGQYFIAMEYLSGESLSMLVKTCRQQRSSLASELAAGITEARVLAATWTGGACADSRWPGKSPAPRTASIATTATDAASARPATGLSVSRHRRGSRRGLGKCRGSSARQLRIRAHSSPPLSGYALCRNTSRIRW